MKARNLILLLLLTGFSGAVCAQSGKKIYQKGAVPQGYTLVWFDEFDYKGMPDSAAWGYEKERMRKKEVQSYTAANPANVSVQKGLLTITARMDSSGTSGITSANVSTFGKMAFRPGCRIEIAAKIPRGAGAWPSIRLIGADHSEIGWPKCGEMVVMENTSDEPAVVRSSVHTEGSVHSYDPEVVLSSGLRVSQVWDDFHVFAVEWEENEIRFFLDHLPYFTYPRPKYKNYWHFSKPFFLTIGLAVGGTSDEGADSVLPLEFQVDYVRYYRKKDE